MKARAFSLMAVVALSCNTGYANPQTDQQAFAAHCAKCHGESGTGTFMLGRRYGKELGMLEKRSDLAPELIRHVVRNGIVSMPAITRVEVTDQDLDAIVRHLTRKQDTPASSSKP